ncbi:MAG: hypothetical protein AAFU77_15485 [Myxococcota bacterium]
MLALALSTLLTSAPMPEEGSTCALGSPLVVSSQERGRGKRVRLRKSSTLVLIKLGKGWSLVRVGESDAFARSRKLLKRCVWSSPPADAGFDEGRVAMASL